MLLLLACQPVAVEGPTLTVATFNTGLSNTEDEVHETLDAWYGNGLAWLPALDEARAWAEATRPDLVAFQEIFDPAECEHIPPEHHAGFVCEEWAPGDPHVALQVLGEGWSVSCHPGNTDKCLAVRDGFGAFAEEAWGAPVEGCGGGARVARAHVTGGVELSLVGMHGSSGLDAESDACRVAQVEQVFVDLGDGLPGADGALNLVMGDLNTDPGRFSDDSAGRWNDFVGEGRAFRWHTEVGPEAPGSYAGLADIDHVASDGLEGGCRVDEKPHEGFDHRPIVCTLLVPQEDP